MTIGSNQLGTTRRRIAGLSLAWLSTGVLSAGLLSAPAWAQNTVEASDLDTEVFSLGVFTGLVNIEDFGSEWLVGLSGTFQASESFFLQYNYFQADTERSSFEKSQGSYFSGADREFNHYDLLVGYNIFQGEIYPEPGAANLSSFYAVGGVGETDFGGEKSFTLTYGLGYQAAVARQVILSADYRIHRYDSSLIRGEEESTENTQFSVGLSYLF